MIDNKLNRYKKYKNICNQYGAGTSSIYQYLPSLTRSPLTHNPKSSPIQNYPGKQSRFPLINKQISEPNIANPDSKSKFLLKLDYHETPEPESDQLTRDKIESQSFEPQKDLRSTSTKIPIITDSTNKSTISRSIESLKRDIIVSSDLNDPGYKLGVYINQYLKFKFDSIQSYLVRRSSHDLTVVKDLGSGSFSQAYLVKTTNNENVVLKFGHKQDYEYFDEDINAWISYQNEGRKVVSLISYGIIDKSCIPGLGEDRHYTLSTFVKNPKKLSYLEKMKFLKSGLKDYSEVYKRGDLHSDYKLANFGFDPNSKELKLVDVEKNSFYRVENLGSSKVLNVNIPMFLCAGYISVKESGNPVCSLKDYTPLAKSLSLNPFIISDPYKSLYNIINLINLILELFGIDNELISHISDLLSANSTIGNNASNCNGDWIHNWWQNKECFQQIYEIYVNNCNEVIDLVKNLPSLGEHDLFLKALLINLIKCLRDNIDPLDLIKEAIHEFTSTSNSSEFENGKLNHFRKELDSIEKSILDTIDKDKLSINEQFYPRLIRIIQSFLEILDYYLKYKDIISYKDTEIVNKLKEILERIKSLLFYIDNLKLLEFYSENEPFIKEVLSI